MASPAPSHDTQESSSASISPELSTDHYPFDINCPHCHETYDHPRVLQCLHTFCQNCLDTFVDGAGRIKCPECNLETILTSEGTAGLIPDLAVLAILQSDGPVRFANSIPCTACKNRNTDAVSRCKDCNNFLCNNCVMAHQQMICFEGHRLELIKHSKTVRDALKEDFNPTKCQQHTDEILQFFCRMCSTPICQKCREGPDHYNHDCVCFAEVGRDILQLGEQARVKANDLSVFAKNVDYTSKHLQTQRHTAINAINDTYNYCLRILEEHKERCLKDLENISNEKQAELQASLLTMNQYIQQLYQGAEFIEKLTKYTTVPETLMFKKTIEKNLNDPFNYCPEISKFTLEFVSNRQIIHTGIMNIFGYVRHSPNKPKPIARPSPLVRPTTQVNNGHYFDSNKDFSSSALYHSMSDVPIHSMDPIAPSQRPWSVQLQGADGIEQAQLRNVDSLTEMTSRLISANVYPPKSHVKREKMVYTAKFGEFGVMESQFTEPSGVAVNAQNDIIVADTNNHRIQIFDKDGKYVFQFGQCGKLDGQLLYPNRVAVVKNSGDIVVTERSPTHQVQIYNQYGQFVRKFGANILQHPRGVTVDNMGRIIIVECKVMRVIIFDQDGTVVQKFGCSKHLEFPNGVVVNDNEEIFISDNRAHCVKVFNYRGEYIKQIGGEGITNYPIGVGISNTGEILIADNHNNFNVTIFKQDTTMVSALESKVKHAQCFDVALMDDGSIVLASKDYRLYIYRYLSLQHI